MTKYNNKVSNGETRKAGLKILGVFAFVSATQIHGNADTYGSAAGDATVAILVAFIALATTTMFGWLPVKVIWNGLSSLSRKIK